MNCLNSDGFLSNADAQESLQFSQLLRLPILFQFLCHTLEAKENARAFSFDSAQRFRDLPLNTDEISMGTSGIPFLPDT
jgi:hypothetical protein